MFQKVKGATDFFPEEMALRNYVFDKLRETCVNYNFSEVEPPVLEHMDLLTAKSGDEIRKQLFVMEKKGDEDVGLRFEGTAGVARMFIEKQKTLPKPVKWFSVMNMWRYERPQKGRLREFFQLSVELLGANRPEADAEAIMLAIDSLRNFGLKEKDFVVLLNNRRMLHGTIKKMLGVGEDKAKDVMRAVDKKGKLEEKEFDAMLKDMHLSEEQVDKLKEILAVDNLKEFSVLEMDTDAKAALAEFSLVIDALKLKKKYIQFDPTIVRGLDYYTDTVFEIYDSERKFRAIAGGGRYDTMIASFGGIPCPATGFAMGYSTLTLLLSEKGLIPDLKEGPDYFIATVNDGMKAKARELAEALRRKNSVEMDLIGKNLRNQFEMANSMKAKKVIVLGPDELKDNKVIIKDMLAGTEEIVALTDLLKL